VDEPSMPLEKRVETLLAAMAPEDKMELLREGWGSPVFQGWVSHF